MYEQDFKAGLRQYLNDSQMKHIVIANKACIRADVFSKILNTNRRIFAEEAGRICTAVGMTFEEVLNYGKKTQEGNSWKREH